MIYIYECRLCGREELTLDCLKDLSICGTCWIAPPANGLNLDYSVKAGRIETLVNIQNLRKNNILFGVGSSGVE